MENVVIASGVRTPIGAMRMVTLLHEMKRRGVRYGLETICGGGGQGICAIVESV